MFASRSSLRRPRVAKTLLVLAVLAAALWVGGLFAFVGAMPGEDDPISTEATDAIIVLTGGSGRLDEGLNLLDRKQAKKLFISGVYRGVDVARLLELSRREPNDFLCCVNLGYAADSTAGNAEESARWVRQQGFHSVRLVTADYHMPRSLLEFARWMPEVTVIPHAVFPQHVKRTRWWTWPGTTRLIVSEYHKFVAAWLRMMAMSALAGSR